MLILSLVSDFYYLNLVAGFIFGWFLFSPLDV